jgi:hypothetical protein
LPTALFLGFLRDHQATFFFPAAMRDISVKAYGSAMKSKGGIEENP